MTYQTSTTNLPKLKDLELVFENTEAYHIFPKNILGLTIDDVSQVFDYRNYDHEDDFSLSYECKYFSITLKYDAINRIKTWEDDGYGNKIGLADRMLRIPDITQVNPTYIQDKHIIQKPEIWVPYSDHSIDDPDNNWQTSKVSHAWLNPKVKTLEIVIKKPENK